MVNKPRIFSLPTHFLKSAVIIIWDDGTYFELLTGEKTNRWRMKGDVVCWRAETRLAVTTLTGQTRLTSAASLKLLGDILQGDPKYYLEQGVILGSRLLAYRRRSSEFDKVLTMNINTDFNGTA